MQKKPIIYPLKRIKEFRHIHLRIKFFLILSFAGSLVVSATSYSQMTKVEINFRDSVPVTEIFREIEKTTEFIFIYDANLIDANIKMPVTARNERIETVLNKLFKDSNVSYRIDDRQVFLYQKEKPESIEKQNSNSASKQQEQVRTISGTVIGSDKMPIIGATVLVKGTSLGALTDLDGKYSLKLPEGSKTLVFSFIGLQTQEVTIGATNIYDMTLTENSQMLEEVVVVGYGIQKKESVVGAITQVNNATIMKSGTSNITNAIAGKLSGVLTIQNSGEPGNNSSEIIIRGLSSWNGSSPLVLVDGVERDFTDIDPNEINTISVLKDASATAVFGAKGANGVVIVTTKRGILGKPKLEISASYGMEKATRLPEHISSYTTMSLMNVAKMNGRLFDQLMPQSVLEEYRNPSSPLNSIRYPDVDWYDILTKPFAPAVDANINLSGGTKFVRYFVSAGYMYEGGFFKGYQKGFQNTSYQYNRFNYRANLDFSVSKTTTISLNIGGDLGIKNQPNGFSWKDLYFTSGSRFPAYFPEWVMQEVPDPDYPDITGVRLSESLGEHHGNPYTSLNNGSFNRYLDSKLLTDILLDQKLDFILKGLSFKGKASLNTYFNHRSLYGDLTFPRYQIYYERIGTNQNPWFRTGEGNEVWKLPPFDINVGGLEGKYYSDLYYEFSLNYGNSFGSHNVSGMLLTNRQQKDKETAFPFYNAALVGRATYDFKHKYLVEVNVGYTGSEQFAPANRYGFFPSGALGWVISEEKFLKTAAPWISKLKLRYSDGLVGSDQADNRWLYMSDFYTSGNYILEDKAPNRTAQWEEARKRDLGMEFGIFKNTFTINIDLFDEYRTRMLLTPRSVTLYVGNTFKELNLGSLKKHGIEIEAEYNKTTKSGLNYFVKGLFGFNENRIVNKDDLPFAPEYTKDAGKPLGAQKSGVLLTGTGYYTSIDDIHQNPAPTDLTNLYLGDYKFLDYTGDGKISILDKYPIPGYTYPPITYSMAGGLSYRGFDFDFMFQGNVGKYVEFNQGFENEFLFQDWLLHKSQLDYWSPSNPDANHSTLHYDGAAPSIMAWGGGGAQEGYYIMIQDRIWRNADYLRLKQVSAGYTFNSNFMKRVMGISNLRIYVTGNNLITFTKLIEGDPERKDFMEGFYPQMTSGKLGLKFSF